MPYVIRLGRRARTDLVGIGAYIAENQSPERARYVLDQIEHRIRELNEFPNRGAYVNELLNMGISDFREVLFRPYRIIYEVVGDEVRVHLIADGRRDMRTLLTLRLLRS